VLVVVGVVVVVVVVVVAGDFVPVELQATDSPPKTIAVAIPVIAASRRELFFTSVIHTQPSCEICCDSGAEKRTGCCQRRAGTPLTPSMECA
jgi:hypothetical protein